MPPLIPGRPPAPTGPYFFDGGSVYNLPACKLDDNDSDYADINSVSTTSAIEGDTLGGAAASSHERPPGVIYRELPGTPGRVMNENGLRIGGDSWTHFAYFDHPLFYSDWSPPQTRILDRATLTGIIGVGIAVGIWTILPPRQLSKPLDSIWILCTKLWQ